MNIKDNDKDISWAVLNIHSNCVNDIVVNVYDIVNIALSCLVLWK